MKFTCPFVAILVLLALSVTPSTGGDKQFKPDEGFTSLFNGKDLTGWEYRGVNPKEDCDGKTATSDGRIEVKDGIILVNVKDKDGKGGIKDLFTKKEYNKDFHLKLEFRAAPKADSGVYIRASGAQLQVRDYPTVGPYKKLKNFKDQDWNTLDIIVKGTSAECKCNGELLEAAMKVPANGGIGLQAESGKFEFRHIQVKELE